MVFNSNKKSVEALKGHDYRIKVIKRFEFSSVHQSNSVIVKNELDNTYRFYIKGAPEKIKEFCNSKFIPKNFNETLKKHTENGFRVLACATKPLKESEILKEFKIFNSNPDTQNKEINKILRAKFENNLIFLGFIIVSNKLKTDTAVVISNLKKSNCKLYMATGDNPFTSISVARQCELIENEDVAFIDFEKNNLKLYFL